MPTKWFRPDRAAGDSWRSKMWFSSTLRRRAREKNIVFVASGLSVPRVFDVVRAPSWACVKTIGLNASDPPMPGCV